MSGDPERLQQVLWNLLSNAVKFTNRGGKVQVRLERVNSHVEVAVSDTGIGIAAGVPAARVRAIPPGRCRHRPRARRSRTGSVNRPPVDRDARRNDRRVQRRSQSRCHVPSENSADDRSSSPRRRPADPSAIRPRAHRRLPLRICATSSCSRSTTSRMPCPSSAEVLQAAGARVSTRARRRRR